MSARTDLRSYAGEHEPPFNLPRDVQDEPRSLVDSWPFLASGIVIASALLLARAWGWV